MWALALVLGACAGHTPPMSAVLQDLCGDPPVEVARPPAPAPLRRCPPAPHDEYTMIGGGRCEGGMCATWFALGGPGEECLDGVRLGRAVTMQFRFVQVGQQSSGFMCTGWLR